MPDTLPASTASTASWGSSQHGLCNALLPSWRPRIRPYILPCLGLYILLFLEAQYFVIQSSLTLPFGAATVSMAPLAYICVGCGAFGAALWLSARAPIAVAAQTSALFWAACGAAGALCCVGAAIWPAQQAWYLLGSALCLGWCLPPIVHTVFCRTSFAAQALIYTCATTLGQMTSIAVYTTGIRAVQIYILMLAVTAVGVIAGLISRKAIADRGSRKAVVTSPAPVPCSPPALASHVAPLVLAPAGPESARGVTQACLLLLAISVLFFGVHSMHNGDFHQYSPLRSQMPLWVYYVLMLIYPLLALVAIRFGLIAVGFMAVGLSAFDPVLASLQDSLLSYSIVYGLDAIATYGGTFFITMAFVQLAPRVGRPIVCISLPFIVLNVFYGGYWLVHSVVQWERASVYILSGAFVAVLTPVLALLHRVMFMPQQIPHSPHSAAVAGAPTYTGSHGAQVTAGVGTAETSADLAASWGLSPREAEVFTLMQHGSSYADMGSRLFISEATVKVHASRIFKKSGAKSRAQLMSLLLHAPLTPSEGATPDNAGLENPSAQTQGPRTIHA